MLRLIRLILYLPLIAGVVVWLVVPQPGAKVGGPARIVVASSSCWIRSGPARTASRLGEVHRGVRYAVRARQSAWVGVGRRGWVHRSCLE